MPEIKGRVSRLVFEEIVFFRGSEGEFKRKNGKRKILRPHRQFGIQKLSLNRATVPGAPACPCASFMLLASRLAMLAMRQRVPPAMRATTGGAMATPLLRRLLASSAWPAATGAARRPMSQR